MEACRGASPSRRSAVNQPGCAAAPAVQQHLDLPASISMPRAAGSRVRPRLFEPHPEDGQAPIVTAVWQVGHEHNFTTA